MTEKVNGVKFKKIIESRLRKRLRKELPKDGSPDIFFLDEITEKVLKKVLKRPFEAKKLSFLDDSKDWSFEILKSLPKTGLIVLPWTSDDSAEWFLEGMSKGLSCRPLHANLIPLWSDVTEDEAERYSKLSKLKWRKAKLRTNLLHWKEVTDDNMLHGLQKSISSLNYYTATNK